MIYSVSEVGDMMDFLKACPSVSIEQYMWGLSAPMINLMRSDSTNIHHLSKKEQERRKRNNEGLNIGGEYGFDNLTDTGGHIFE